MTLHKEGQSGTLYTDIKGEVSERDREMGGRAQVGQKH